MKRGTQRKKPGINTLILIGSGFDQWQGLNTSYSDFKKYYLAHRDEILKKLHIKKRYFIENGRKHYFSDAELIYGDPFDPGELDDDFWSVFEASLDKLDSEKINLFFGKNNRDLNKMQRSIENAQAILRKAFCGWVHGISIEAQDSGYCFGDNVYCINFNYTDTLTKRFHVAHENHIHGEANDPESIIFGHSAHPQMPTPELASMGGRFLGLYLIEQALYETDKHVDENIQFLCMEMALEGIKAEDIEDIYVLGHSFGVADLGYFDFLVRATSVPNEVPDDVWDEIPDNIDPMEDMHQRIQYAIHRYGEQGEVSDEEEEYVDRRYCMEREAHVEETEKELFKLMGLKRSKKRRQRHRSDSEDVVSPVMRNTNARWHISYYSEKDKKWIDTVMKQLGCADYTLYPTIEECIECFKCQRED